MNIDFLYHPHRQEEVSVTVDTSDYNDLSYHQWCELMETVENGSVSYATWYQNEETDHELMVLNHEYKIKDGVVVSYDQELTD